MGISIFSFTSTLILLGLFILILHPWIRRRENAAFVHPLIWIITMLLPFIRLLLPIEFFFTRNIKSTVIATAIYDLLEKSLYGIPVFTLLNFAIMVWSVGSIIAFFSVYSRYQRITHIYKNANRCTNCKAWRILKSYEKQFPKVSCIDIRESTLISEPMIFGVRKPVLLIPKLHYNITELQSIMGHELGHFINGDIWIKWMLEAISATFWWFPPVYLLRQHTYNCMEVRADRFAVHKEGLEKRIKYLDSLVRIASRQQNVPQNNIAFSATLLGDATAKTLRIRFLAIKEIQNISAIRIKSVALMLMLFTTMFLSFAFVIRPDFSNSEYVISDFTNTFGADDLETGNFYLVPYEDGYNLYNGSVYMGFLDDRDQTPPFSNLPIMQHPQN